MNRGGFIKSLTISPLLLNLSSLQGLESWVDKQSPSEKMPMLFLGHGSPMNAIEDNSYIREFRSIAKTLPIPKSILCISAHWYTKGTLVMSSSLPKTIHDFAGFPEELFKVQYPAKGDSKLAREVNELLQSHHSNLSEDWGLDHGAWSVLVHLYPDANIPVIQLSIDYTKPAAYHYELASLLKKLRNRGVLILGSGNIVHNLGMIDWQNFDKDNHGYDWAKEVQEKTNQAILNRNNQYLIDYTKNGKSFLNAIPTPDHYLPLIYTLGMAEKEDKIELFNDKLIAGSLSMTSVKFSS
jgi:4,5-DOPA dioxygenase extradiol